jgi:hypothetical protein
LQSPRTLFAWLQNPAHDDEAIAAGLHDGGESDIDGLVALALTRTFHRALATFEFALWTGERENAPSSMAPSTWSKAE